MITRSGRVGEHRVVGLGGGDLGGFAPEGEKIGLFNDTLFQNVNSAVAHEGEPSCCTGLTMKVSCLTNEEVSLNDDNH